MVAPGIVGHMENEVMYGYKDRSYKVTKAYVV